jgi:glycosyltransferase involved in cell wall biosynthesis
LVNQDEIPHYRLPVYGYLTSYLKRYGYDLIICSEGIQKNNPYPVLFKFVKIQFSLLTIPKFINNHQIDAIIFWVNLRHLHLLPICLLVKFWLHKKVIYWGHGRDLADRRAWIKNFGYMIQQGLSDSIILYAEHLKKYLPARFHKKTFIANNTLYLGNEGAPIMARQEVLKKYGINSNKNVICVGRIQKRKKIENLAAAFLKMGRPDIGLILVGPDPDRILEKINGKNIFKLGPIYGERKLELLSIADVFCIPGAVGLSIVDAFHCGLPLVTEDGDESPEIMYLKDGVNGFIVPLGNINEMAKKLLLLIDNDALRLKFSEAAKKEIAINGNIDKMCSGFREALLYVIR